MTAIAELIRSSPVLFAVISGLDGIVHLTGCTIVTVLLFRLVPRKKAWVYLLCTALYAVYGIMDAVTWRAEDEQVRLIFTVFAMLVPYGCAALLFPKKGLWKALLTTVGYTFVEAIRFLVLMLFYRFDNDARDDALELPVEFLVDVICFLLAYVFLARRAKKHTEGLNVTKNAAILFLLIVGSVAVFVTSLLLLSPDYISEKQSEFGFILLNIPMLTGTVSYAIVSFFRLRARSETYREQLNMQIRQYEWMEHMNEDLRIFRHDFPKKMRPLIAYLEADDTEEALRMAEQFSGFVADTAAPFRTGNSRLDTVLNCEQQVALKDDIRIHVPFGTVFPKDGIAADDIYTIFPNALDNAIEAARAVDRERVITFTSRVAGNTVYVTITNPVAGEIKQKNGLPQTTKADKKLHGYGFRSMKKAAAKYGKDNVSFSAENGVFELRIFFELPGAPQG